MEPQIGYVRSADGTKIAIATMGSGPRLVMIPTTPLASIEGGWTIASERAGIERMASSHTLITFDPRGQGLSDRDVADLSLEARIADIEAVFGTLPAGPVFFYSRAWQAPPAIAFATRHPDRVRRLVLSSGSAARGRDYVLNEKRRALAPILDVDWELYCSALAFVEFGWTDEARNYATVISKTTTPDIVRRNWISMRQHDVSDLLTSLRCPTLVLYTPNDRAGVQPDAARSLAALIPGARLRPVEGPFTQVGLAPGTVEQVLQFFAEDTPERGSAAKLPAELPSGTAVILFTDIAESTPLTERLGDAAFRELSRATDERVRAAIRECGGRPVEGKVLGDGVMGIFTSAAQGIAAARRCQEIGREVPMHIGLHAGDVMIEQNNAYGGAVNIASRICSMCEPGQILVSQTVRDLARTSAGVQFGDCGEHALKGISEPQRLFAVRERV